MSRLKDIVTPSLAHLGKKNVALIELPFGAMPPAYGEACYVQAVSVWMPLETSGTSRLCPRLGCH